MRYDTTLNPEAHHIYIDDGGDYSARPLLVAIAIPQWALPQVRAATADLRWRLRRFFFGEADFEWHGSHMIRGQSRIRNAPHPLPQFQLDFIARYVLSELARSPGVRVYGLVWFLDKQAKEVSGKKRIRRLYNELLQWIEEDLSAEGAPPVAALTIDGRDPNFSKEHKVYVTSNPSSRLLVAPEMADSKRNHLIQFADLVSFALNAHLAPKGEVARAQRWFEEHVAARAAAGADTLGYRKI
ncbi:MAG: hypothetical protein QOH16_3875 [Gaiellaceae bacterium]|nr:hypothetical protein [Gaiellaceae bacterium]